MNSGLTPWNTRLLSLPFLLLALGPAAGVSRAEPVAAAPATIAPRSAEAPKIDGKIDEAVWEAVEWQGGQFTELNRPAHVLEAQTRFKIVHDAEALYIAVRLDEPNMAGLVCNLTGRDDKIYNDDCVEIFLDANRDRSTHFQLVANAAGVVYDSEVRQGGVVHDNTWNAKGLRVATGRGADHWTVEMALPFVALQLDGASRGDWGFNVARERQAGGKTELGSFTPLTGGFHQPSLFSLLRLADADLGPFLWDVKPPFDLSVRERDGVPILFARTHVQNHSGDFRFLKVTATLDSAGGGSDTRTLGLDDEQGEAVELAIPAGANGKAGLRIEIAERDSGRLLAERTYPVTVKYSPLTITLRSPSYRNLIFSSQNLREIAGRIAINLAPGRCEGKTLRMALLDGTGRAAAEKSLAAAETAEFTLPIEDLPDGDYQLEAELSGAGAEPAFRTSVRVRKLPKSDPEVWLDGNLVLRINGQPFLPWGWFSIPEADLGAPHNVVMDYNAYYRTDAELQGWLDQVQAAGMRAVLYPYASVADSHLDRGIAGTPLSESEAGKIRAFVRKWKRHPALLAWYLGDEPELVPVLPARLEAVKAVCEEEDPYRPCIMLNDSVSGIQNYINTGDIMMPDPYPLFIEGGRAATPIEKVSKFISAVHEASGSALAPRAAWVTPQAFNYGDFGSQNNRQPNFDELRNMTYQCVALRATGFIWWTYYLAYNYPDLLAGMGFLSQEIQRLEPAILAPQASRRIDPEETGGMLLADYRKVNGQEYVFAVNLSTGALGAVTIPLPEGAATAWRVMSEDRKLDATGELLTDTFDGYAVHVYTTAPLPEREPTIVQARQRIANVLAKHVRGKPGNLASGARGTTVKAVSGDTSKYGNRLRFLLDGVWKGSGWNPGSATGNEWIEIAFAQQVRIGRVVVASQNLTECAVEIPDGKGGWTEVGRLIPAQNPKPGIPRSLEATFPPQVIPGLRIVLQSVREMPSASFHLGLLEIEAYEK